MTSGQRYADGLSGKGKNGKSSKFGGSVRTVDVVVERRRKERKERKPEVGASLIGESSNEDRRKGRVSWGETE